MVKYINIAEVVKGELKGTLLFLSQIEHVDWIHANEPKILEACHILTASFDVTTHLFELGYRSSLSEDCISGDLRQSIQTTAEVLTNTWFSKLQRYYSLCNVSAPWIDKNSQLWFFRDSLYVRTLFEQFIKKNSKIHRVLIPGPLVTPCIDYMPNDTPCAVLAFLANKVGIDTYLITKNMPTSPLIVRVLRRVYRVMHNLVSTRQKNVLTSVVPTNPICGFAVNNQPKTAICVHGMAFAQDIVDTLIESGHQIVLIEISPIPEQLRNMVLKQGIVFDCRQNFTDLNDTETLQNCEVAWTSFKEDTSQFPEYPELFENSLLDFHFRHYFFERWPRLLRRVKQLDSYLDKYHYKCFLTSNLDDVENMAICSLFKEKKVPILAGLHSGWPDPVALFQLADVALVWSKFHFEALSRIIETPIRAVGAIGFDISSEFISTTVRKEAQRTVLFVGNGITTGLYPLVDSEMHLKALGVLFNVPKDLRNSCRVLVKTKPWFDHPHTYQVLRQQSYEPSSVLICDAEMTLKEAIKYADICVMVNVPTTGYHEVIMQSKPLVFISNTPFTHPGLPRLPTDQSLVIEDLTDVWPQLRKLLQEPNTLQNLVDMQKNIYDEDMPVGKAGSLLIETLNEFT